MADVGYLRSCCESCRSSRIKFDMVLRYVVTASFALVLLDVRVYGKQLTFINEYESSVRLSDMLWKGQKKLEFKLTVNGEDGTVLTARTHSDNRFQISCKSDTFHLKLNDESQNLPGLTDRKLSTRDWISFSVSQSEYGLVLRVNDIMVFIPLEGRPDLMIENWKDVYIGTHTMDGKKARSFVGCFELVSLSNSDSNLVNDDEHGYILERNSVLNSCVDACSVNSCKNGARCLNSYNRAVCDCRGTGYQGATCELVSPAMFFDGSSFLAYDAAQNPNLDWQHDIHVRFSTKESQGIILATSFEEDFLTIELHQGLIYVTARFGQATTHMKIGQSLGDGHWHFLVLGHRRGYLQLQLDDTVTAKAMLADSFKFAALLPSTLRMIGGEELVFFGGAKDIGSLKFSHSKTNFKGCLQQLLFNGQDVLEKVIFTGDWKFTRHGKLQECHEKNT